jgi:hypothetical protein
MHQTVAHYDRREGQYWVPNPEYCTLKEFCEIIQNRIYANVHFLLRMTNTVTLNIGFPLRNTPYIERERERETIIIMNK